MTWTRLDDHFLDHPKILAAGERAELLHIHALLYCNKHLTDGFVPEAAISHLLHAPQRQAVQRLIELCIWVVVDGGYQIHDFLDWNPSREAVLTLRAQNTARQAESRQRRAVTNPATNPVSSAVSVSTPSRPVPSVGSKDPVRDAALREGTVPRGTTNGEATRLGDLLPHFPSVSRKVQ